MKMVWGALAALWAGAAYGAPVCAVGANDDYLRPVPPSLIEKAKDIFGLSMPDDLVQRSTVFRCADGAVMICNMGANLPCGKADMSQSLPGATAWCREHPGDGVVPAFATGHDTIYAWHCDGMVARAGKPIENVDSRGFLTRFWRKAD